MAAQLALPAIFLSRNFLWNSRDVFDWHQGNEHQAKDNQIDISSYFR